MVLKCYYSSMLNKIRTVLIHNSHPGNIGATARALKNMGLSQLYLVAPQQFPDPIAWSRAASAVDILENAVVVPTVEEALKGCQWVYGTSSRDRTLEWPTVNARQASFDIIQALSETPHDIAILYGCEQHGLSNVELQHCHHQIYISADKKYASLNLAQAVQIVSYEIWVSYYEAIKKEEKERIITANATTSTTATTTTMATTTTPNIDTKDLATFDDMNGFYVALEKTLMDIHFLDPKQPGKMMTRLRRLFSRAKPDKIELNLLRGMLNAIQDIPNNTQKDNIQVNIQKASH